MSKNLIKKIKLWLKKILPKKELANKFLIFGVVALLLGKVLTLQEKLETVSGHLETIARNEGIKLYDRKEMKKITLGNIYLEVPQEWDNFIENYSSSNLGVRKHFISSAGSGFALPYSSEYAFMTGIERKNVSSSLETFLQTQTLDSDPKNKNKEFTQLNENMFYIRREGIGVEYFKKVNSTVIVVFVYDNGDRVIDDLEQRIVNSVGVIETERLFDYR